MNEGRLRLDWSDGSAGLEWRLCWIKERMLRAFPSSASFFLVFIFLSCWVVGTLMVDDRWNACTTSRQIAAQLMQFGNFCKFKLIEKLFYLFLICFAGWTTKGCHWESQKRKLTRRGWPPCKLCLRFLSPGEFLKIR